ncbi:hypothetical protein [Clavibacter michiganensis]|uniref:hypothetical protein n=1 Tax=Clavibacter michiganensis TaxID=28447 RepID=UPI0012DD2E2A|nr:hypothetical protein [Clavibacter michiganensis]
MSTSTTAPTIRLAALALGAGVLLLAGCTAAPTDASPAAPADDASTTAPMDPGMDMPMEAGPGSHPRRLEIDLRPARPVALLAVRIQGRRGPPLGALAA